MAEIKNGNLKPQIPSQGWDQLRARRKALLDEYDKAKVHSKNHKVETYHGKVAEAAIRKWLSSFLPKRYAVTSGYVVSPGLSKTDKLIHFDVIIYDHLEAPILWIEENADLSEQGKSIAIPAEYVRAVIEVKSAFNRQSIKDAIYHLNELKDLLSGFDDINQPYKLYLPNYFFSSVIFIELRRKDSVKPNVLDLFTETTTTRGFSGGIILRAEEIFNDSSAIISPVSFSEDDMKKEPKMPDLFTLPAYFSKSIVVKSSTKYGIGLMYRRNGFSQYSFDLISRLNGTYHSGQVSSFFGVGV